MDRCRADQLLERLKVRKTPARLATLETILELESTFTTSQLLTLVSERVNIDQATVYRIVTLLLERLVIREVAVLNGIQHYELACIHNPVHPHLICSRCGRIECLEAVDFDRVLTLINYDEDFQIDNINININGICKRCRE